MVSQAERPLVWSPSSPMSLGWPFGDPSPAPPGLTGLTAWERAADALLRGVQVAEADLNAIVALAGRDAPPRDGLSGALPLVVLATGVRPGARWDGADGTPVEVRTWFSPTLAALEAGRAAEAHRRATGGDGAPWSVEALRALVAVVTASVRRDVPPEARGRVEALVSLAGWSPPPSDPVACAWLAEALARAAWAKSMPEDAAAVAATAQAAADCAPPSRGARPTVRWPGPR